MVNLSSELDESQAVLLGLFTEMYQLDYDELTPEKKKSLANRLIKACLHESRRAVLKDKYSQLIHLLMKDIDMGDLDNYVGESLDRLDTLEKVLEQVLLSYEASSVSSDDEGLSEACDAAVGFVNRVVDYKVPFKAASARNEETIRLLKGELKEAAKGISDDANKKILGLKEKMTVDHIAILGVFSAIALSFMGGMSWGLETLSVSASMQYVHVFLLAIVFVFFGLFNLLSILMYFIAVIVGRHEELLVHGRSVWLIVNSLTLIAFVFVAMRVI